MSYSRSNTGIKFNSSMGSIARLSTLRKSFLSPVSEAVSAASAKSASISYLTPTEAAYLRTTSIRAPSSSSSSSGSSVSASLSTSLSSTKSSKTKSSSRISDMTTTGSSQAGSYGYDIASLTSSPSRSPASVISPSESSPTVSSSTQRSENGPIVMSASAAASVAASMAASVAAASIAVASARASNSSNKSLNSFMRESAKLNSSPCVCHSSSSNHSKNSRNSYIKPNNYMSKIEASILRSSEPIPICETQEITAAGNRGIFANRCEVCTWKGDLPINEYPINEDACPNVINKRLKQKLEYVQEMAVRYLKPPTPPAPGEIIIKQEPNKPVAPAPPIVIRQQPPRPCTPEPLVIREAPPPAPPMCGRKVITISGKQLPAPPRKVVIERMPPIPSKPQSVVIERWLPYTEQKRRVIYQKAPPDPVVCKPKNIIVQWEAPEVCIKKDVRHLGVIRANPCEYVQKYGCSLKQPCDLPQFVRDIQPQCGIELAANKPYNPVHQLEGDVCALKYVNLECEGLNIYKEQVKEKCEKKACGLCVPQSAAKVIASHRSSPKYASKYYNSAIKFGASPASVRSSSSNSSDKNHNTSGSSSSNENDAVNASYGSSFSSNSSSGCGDCEARFSYTISTTEEVVSPTCSPVVSSPAKFM